MFNRPNTVISKKIKTTIALVIMVLITSDKGYAINKAKTKSHIQKKQIKINPISTGENAWTANFETNIYQSGTFENIALGYSTVNGWDFSLALLNTQITGNNQQFQGNTFLNIAKTLTITPNYSLVMSTQNGVALINTHPQLWYNFTFIDNRYEMMPWLSIHGGGYLANAAITGTSRQLGFLAGIEIIFIQNKWSLQIDYVSGHHSLSGANINTLLNITPRCQVYIGVYVPEQSSGNEFAGIMGVNFSTSDF
jgi:hypothetical protein